MSLTATPTSGTTTATAPRRTARRVGLVISTLVVVFLTFDSVTHLLLVDAVREANADLGGTDSFARLCGALLALCLITHLIPRTAVLGAVLLTGYLGGAVCANLITDAPDFNVVFAVATGVLVWVGLGLRDPRVRLLVSV